MNCECCGKTLQIAMANQKYCSECSLHSKESIHIIGRLKYELEELKSKYYKMKNRLEKKMSPIKDEKAFKDLIKDLENDLKNSKEVKNAKHN